MRRDVFIMNDSGGFSVLAASAASAIINERLEELDYVMAHQVLLLELYGDDSIPVRLVVNEPLLPEEEAQWLAHVSGRIETPDGRLLVMGGFDPDVLAWWQEDHAPDEDGDSVAVVQASPGSWRVDVYAHVGSMNGRQILSRASDKPGAFFRRCYPERAFPVWLAKMLEYSGEDDPGHEDLWHNVAASVREGRLSLDLNAASAIGFLIHITPFSGAVPESPPEGWFDYDAGQRMPDLFPLGLTATVPDPELESFLDRILSRPQPIVEPPVATELIEIIETWSGDLLQPLIGGQRQLAPTSASYIYWMTALCADSPPRFELWITADESWAPPKPSPECAVVHKGVNQGSVTWALGPPPNTGGWFTWNAAQIAASGLTHIPDGSMLILAMTPDLDDDDVNPAVGRALYSGQVQDGMWQITEASPALSLETLNVALTFVAELIEHQRILVDGEAEKRVLDATAAMYLDQKDRLVWDGDTVSLAEPDQRLLLLLAEPVFRTHFATQWLCDPIDADEEW
ncbi:MAG: hypothetical protein ACTS2F_15590 [Thainema sp.]